MLVVLGFNFLGDGLRDILDPRIGGSVANVAAPKTATHETRSSDAPTSSSATALIVDGSGAPAVPRRRRGRGREDRRRRRHRRARGAERTIEADGPDRLPGLRRPAQPQRLHAPHEPDRAVDDPPGRDDRGRRQLRLDLRAGLGALAPFVEARLRTFAYDGPGRVGDASPSTSRSSRTPGHSQNLAWFVGHNTVRYAAGVFEPQATEEQLRRDGAATSPRRWTRARSASRPGSSSTRAARRRPTSSSG